MAPEEFVRKIVCIVCIVYSHAYAMTPETLEEIVSIVMAMSTMTPETFEQTLEYQRNKDMPKWKEQYVVYK